MSPVLYQNGAKLALMNSAGARPGCASPEEGVSAATELPVTCCCKTSPSCIAVACRPLENVPASAAPLTTIHLHSCCHLLQVCMRLCLPNRDAFAQVAELQRPHSRPH